MADRTPAPDTPELRERWGSFAFNEAYEAKAQKALARYPEGRKKSAVKKSRVPKWKWIV